MKDLNNRFRELSEKETMGVGAGFLPILLRVVFPTVANMIVYSFNKHNNKEPITVQGLAIAGGTGLVTGGIGATAGAAAGGGVVGNIVWMPGTMALNASGNLIAQEH